MKIYVNDDYIKFISNTLSVRVRLFEENITHIIGLSRGGLIPATYLSYKLDCNLLCYGLKSYKEEERGSIEITQSIDFNTIPKESGILVVDDICDSGETFKFVKKQLKDNGFKSIKFLSIFVKDKSIDLVDYYGVRCDEDNWVVFPWE